MADIEQYHNILKELKKYHAQLIAVSKTEPVESILQLYQAGQRAFGENKVQEMCEKRLSLPEDIEWHMVGHLQTNKVKYIAPFVSLIHSVDSVKLLEEINKQALKNNRTISCLLQVHIAAEESKFGFSEEEVYGLLQQKQFKLFTNVRIAGLMGMASNTDNSDQVEHEFEGLRQLFLHLKQNYFTDNSDFKELSMGMSSDYPLALKHGATLIRIGTILFGKRNYH